MSEFKSVLQSQLKSFLLLFTFISCIFSTEPTKKCSPELTVGEASRKEKWVKFKEAVGFIKAHFFREMFSFLSTASKKLTHLPFSHFFKLLFVLRSNESETCKKKKKINNLSIDNLHLTIMPKTKR